MAITSLELLSFTNGTEVISLMDAILTSFAFSTLSKSFRYSFTSVSYINVSTSPSLTETLANLNVCKESVSWFILSTDIFLESDISDVIVDHISFIYAVTCSLFASLILSSIKGSTADLNVPTLNICISIPILSSSPL